MNNELKEIKVNAFMTAYYAVVEELEAQYSFCEAREFCDDITKDILSQCNSFEDLFFHINHGVSHTDRDEEWYEFVDKFNEVIEHMWKIYME